MIKHLGVKCNAAAGRQIEKEWEKKDRLALHFMPNGSILFCSHIYAISRASLSQVHYAQEDLISFSSSEKAKMRYIVQTVSVIEHTRFSTEKSLLYACTHLRFHVHATADELTKLNSLLNLLNRYQCKCDIVIRRCLSLSLCRSLCQREYKVITALI